MVVVAPPEPNEALKPETSVFINCPLDPEYADLLDAVVFTTVCCGFVPRIATESGDVAVPRIDRICQALLSSKYSIHDLSRCSGEGDENLARFNMPLELGVAMAKRFLARSDAIGDHDWLVLVPADHSYVRFVSDLAGFDPKKHSETPESIVYAVMSWLCTRPDAAFALSPDQVLAALPRFKAAMDQLNAQWGNQPPWSKVLAAARYAMPSAGDGDAPE
jgi:hypothetical protein